MSLTFRPDIEGLRALAIVPVVLFHAFPNALPGGFVGVDVFFVISGYLITSLLLERLRSGRYSVASFYGARIRRIFPALFVMLALVTPLAVWLLAPKDLQGYGRTLGATALFLSNMELYRTTGYFEAATDLKPLVHTWSLAVEEQYYVVFPLLLSLLHRRWPRAIAPVLLAVAGVSLLVCLYWLRWDPSLAFYSAASRTCELMVGSWLAVEGARRQALPWQREWAAGLGVLGIVAACVLLTPETPFPGPAALWPCFATALVIWAGGHGTTWAGHAISWQPLRWVGALSFSLYLWHWPMLVFARHLVLGQPGPMQSAVAVALAVLMAWLSLKWVETPVRKAAATDRRLMWGGALCMGVTMALASALVAWPASIQGLSPQAEALYAGAQDFSPERKRCHEQGRLTISYAERCVFGEKGQPASWVVWGDSHGAELALALGERAASRHEAVAQITSSSCPPALALSLSERPACAAHNDSILQALVRDDQVRRVVLVARYEHYMHHQAAELERGLQRTIRALHHAGKAVVLVEPIPTYAYPQPAAWAAWERRPDGLLGERPGMRVQADQDSQAAALHMVRRLAGQGDATLLRTADFLCPGSACLSASGSLLYFDDNHLSMAGARVLAAGLIP